MYWNSTNTVFLFILDTDPECDIYKDFYQACGNHAYCVLDAYTQKAHCRCVDYGKHKTNGTCKSMSIFMT